MRARLGGAGEGGQEDDQIQPGTCRQRGGGLGYQLIPDIGHRGRRGPYTNFLDTTGDGRAEGKAEG